MQSLIGVELGAGNAEMNQKGMLFLDNRPKSLAQAERRSRDAVVRG